MPQVKQIEGGYVIPEIDVINEVVVHRKLTTDQYVRYLENKLKALQEEQYDLKRALMLARFHEPETL